MATFSLKFLISYWEVPNAEISIDDFWLISLLRLDICYAKNEFDYDNFESISESD